MGLLVLFSLFLLGVSADYKPVSVFVLTRHGARAPYLSIPGIRLDTWECSFSLFQYPGIAPVSPSVSFNGQLYRKAYMPNVEALPGNCSQGQLTNVGALMLRSTGQWLRNKLGAFFPQSWDHDTMYARSTDIDRCQESAQNLLISLFPTPSPTRKGAKDTSASVVNIWTVEKGYDWLDVAVNAACPALTAKCTEISTSIAWQAHQASLAPIVAAVAQSFQIPESDVPDVFLVLEVLRARRAQGLYSPVSETLYKQVEAAASWELRQLYNNQTVHQLTSGQLVGNVLDTFSSIINGTLNRTFTLYAAHDTTVAPFLSALSIDWETWPQYAAFVYLGLLQDSVTGEYAVELIHDGQPVIAGGCGPICPWKQFVQIASKSVVSNRQQQCASRKRALLADPIVEYLC